MDPWRHGEGTRRVNTLAHFLYFAFDPWNFVTNISAEVVQVAAIFGVWKATKRWLAPRLRHLLHRVLSPHLEAHAEAIKAHITAELERLR